MDQKAMKAAYEKSRRAKRRQRSEDMRLENFYLEKQNEELSQQACQLNFDIHNKLQSIYDKENAINAIKDKLTK